MVLFWEKEFNDFFGSGCTKKEKELSDKNS